MIKIKVPATSANMGAGFDTLGIALSLYNHLDITEIPKGIEIVTNHRTAYESKGENNLIYRAMRRVFDETGFHHDKGIKIIQNANIPMTRGLGSSSACIVGGMVAANIMSGRKLDYKDILELATDMEGHPDNVTPALFGGFCSAAKNGKKVEFVSYKPKHKYKFAVMIPDFFLATKKSRSSLPETVSYADAVHNISRAVVFAMGLMTGREDVLHTGVDDRLHQPYRKGYVDGLDDIFAVTYESGALATYLSGSGPTVMSVLPWSEKSFKTSMERFFAENSHEWTCKILYMDNVGTVAATLGEYD